jgi:hypothetical protein
MRLEGDDAEVAACCAEQRSKSMLSYAFHELRNSIGNGKSTSENEALSGTRCRPPRLEVRLRSRRSARLHTLGGRGNFLVFVHGKQHVIAEVMPPQNSAAA